MPRRNGYVRPPKRHGRWISEPLRIFRRLVRERHVRGTRHTVPKERGNLIEESIIIQDWFGVNLRVHNRIPGQVGEQNELASVKIDNLSSGDSHHTCEKEDLTMPSCGAIAIVTP